MVLLEVLTRKGNPRMGTTREAHQKFLDAHAAADTARLNAQADCKNYYKIWVAGSARIEEGHPTYEALRQFSERLGLQGLDGLTGGGPGLMAASNAGFHDAALSGMPIRSEGVTISDMPHEKPNAHLHLALPSLSLFDRLISLTSRANAVVCAPGGVGTLLEFTLVLQLLQLGGPFLPKKGHSPLLVLVDEFPEDESSEAETQKFLEDLVAMGYFKDRGPEFIQELAGFLKLGMWEIMVVFLTKLFTMGTINAEDLLHVVRVDTFEEAEAPILEDYAKWKKKQATSESILVH